MKLKQIYAALDIGSYDVKLIVGEFHNARFNVIRVESVLCTGIKQYQIVDSDLVSQSIMQAIKNVNELLNVRIESVLLSIPPYQLKKKNKRISVPILNNQSKVQTDDIKNAIKLAQRSEIADQLIIVNVIPVKYFINGIASRKIPINEICDKLEIEVDLFCVRKHIVYDYVRVVERSGLEVLDIFVQPYAEAKEAAIFEQSIEQYVMYINIGYQMSNLTLFNKGRLIESTALNIGTQEIDAAIMKEFDLSQEVASRLKKYNTHLLVDFIKDNPIYVWSSNNVNYSMTESQLYDTMIGVIMEWLRTFKEVANSLFDLENVKIVLGGGGGEIFELDKLATKTWGIETSTYIPDTMGARSSSLIATLGLFYAYIDACEYTLNEKTSVDTLEFAESILPSKEIEEGFTGKLKGLLFSENKEKTRSR